MTHTGLSHAHTREVYYLQNIPSFDQGSKYYQIQRHQNKTNIIISTTKTIMKSLSYKSVLEDNVASI